MTPPVSGRAPIPPHAATHSAYDYRTLHLTGSGLTRPMITHEHDREAIFASARRRRRDRGGQINWRRARPPICPKAHDA